MANLRKLQQLVKKQSGCNYPQSIRGYMATSCVIPSFWKLSTVLPLADSEGWGAQQAALASVLLPLLCGLPAA